MKKITLLLIMLLLITGVSSANYYSLTKIINGVSVVTTIPEGNNVTLMHISDTPFIRWEVKQGGLTISNPTSKTITFNMPANNVEIEAVVHVHQFTGATCTTPATCSCGETKGTALGHSYTGTVTCDVNQSTDTVQCIRCTSTESQTCTHTYTISKGSETNGTITLSKTSVKAGGSATATITPSSGYKIDSIQVNGSNVAVTNDVSMVYTFSNITSNQTINVTFAIKGDWNAPVLLAGLTPVNWNGSSWTTTSEDNWDYNYNSVATATHSTVAGDGNGKWANAQTEDGSLYVWIPRYTYKITSGEHKNGYSWNSLDHPGSNKIEIKFSNGLYDDTSDNYKQHSAFTFGSDELTGIWVAKYEASKGSTTSQVSTPTASNNVAKSIPNVSCWRTISVSNMYDYAYNTYRNADSHLMKNVEWGAVAYLTNAIGRIPYINNNGGYITGIAGDSQNAAYNPFATPNTWDTAAGVKASTTHNVYGIYDMSGGAFEYVAAYYSGGSANCLSGDTSSKSRAGSLYTAANNSATAKYVDVYSTKYTFEKPGDAVYETSSHNSNTVSSWDGDTSMAPDSIFPVYARGYYYYNGSIAGIFSFDNGLGSEDGGEGYPAHSFRVTLAIPDSSCALPEGPHTITVTQGSNGTISPATTTVARGSNKTFTITPNTGYKIATIVVDGSSRTVTNKAGMTYTFSNVTANHTIKATFTTATYCSGTTCTGTTNSCEGLSEEECPMCEHVHVSTSISGRNDCAEVTDSYPCPYCDGSGACGNCAGVGTLYEHCTCTYSMYCIHGYDEWHYYCSLHDFSGTYGQAHCSHGKTSGHYIY